MEARPSVWGLPWWFVDTISIAFLSLLWQMIREVKTESHFSSRLKLVTLAPEIIGVMTVGEVPELELKSIILVNRALGCPGVWGRLNNMESLAIVEGFTGR
jgi:hypothetical protein